MAGRRVLVVDDDDATIELIQDALEEDGHAVKAARTGEEAIGVWASFAPDVVVTDQRMPGMSGLELVNYLRERITTPLLLHSAYIDDDLAKSARQLNVQLVKKGQMARLREIVAAIEPSPGLFHCPHCRSQLIDRVSPIRDAGVTQRIHVRRCLNEACPVFNRKQGSFFELRLEVVHTTPPTGPD